MAKQYIESLKPIFENQPDLPLNPSFLNTPEIEVMASSLLGQYGPAVMHAAAAVHFVSLFINAYSASTGRDMTPVSRTICAALRQWVASKGERSDDVPKAVASIRQAGETAAYLSAIPD